MKFILRFSFFLFLLIPAISMAQEAPPEETSEYERAVEANRIGNDGLQLIDQGRMEEGLEKVREAIAVEPNDPFWHMNYGSILFGNGSEVYKEGDQEQGDRILGEAENELLKAIELFDASKDQILISQCYFLIGEMYSNVFGDSDKAKAFYQASITFYEHPRSLAAVKKYR